MRALLLVLALAPAAVAGPRAPAAAARAGAAVGAPLVIPFDTLGSPDDRVLRGMEAVESLSFTRPRSWALAGDPVARIRFAHAPGYTERSRLTVRLNGREVGAVALDAGNEAGGVLVVALPAARLADYNTLAIVATQLTAGCERPFDTALWTRIAGDSSIELPGAPAPVLPKVSTMREPLFDPLGYGALRVTPVLPGALSVGSLSALTEVGLALGRVADWRRVDVQDPVATVAEAETAGLLLGTLAEIPEASVLVDTSALSGDQGLVALVRHPHDPTLPVLVVTGLNAAGVRNAARAVARADRAAWITGDVAVVERISDAPPPRAARVPGPVGDRDSVRLSDLGVADHTVDGLYAASLTVPLLLEGDTFPRPDGAEVRVRYAYGAGLDPSLSTLEVRFNDVGLVSVPLDQLEGSPDSVVSVKVPARLVGPHDTLQIGFHLFPAVFDTCGVTTADHLWGTVFADTEVHLARDHAARLPDLSLLKQRWFPFNAEAPGERVTVLLGERAEPYDVAAALQIVADLAARSVAEDPEVILLAGRDERGGARSESGGASEARGGARILLVREDQPHPAWLTLEPGRGGPRSGGLATVEALQPSPEPGTGVLVLRAPDGARLVSLARQLGDDEVLVQLRGSRVVVHEDGGVSTVESVATKWVVRATGLARLRLLLQEHGPAFLSALLPGVLAAGFALRAWARRRGGVTA
ncbi:MAG: cellulose biosynthesis cyclic di-GMP-binding regulatory protein BcsB [Pseudomonadota bacterium]|nr:cellulose biosynthesis cyclic di-GMP-binding regulatory protein BcsB [Pseudomonadota bacterium]